MSEVLDVDGGPPSVAGNNSSNKSITCFNIPELFVTDRTAAKRHFGRFGTIHSVTLRPRQLACTVEFDAADAAADAIAVGFTYEGHVFEIGYTDKPRGRPRAVEPDPDVQMELNAMLREAGGMGGPVQVQTRTTTLATVAQRNGSPVAKRKEESVVVPKVAPAVVAKVAPAVVARARNGNGGGTSSPRRKPTIAVEALRSLDSAIRNELETLMRKPAYTSEDKYRVLDARDKLIRLTTTTTTDLARAVTTLGLCPDLCPEKERLMRDATHHIATFEMDGIANGATGKQSLQPAYALKQYSRSSADQEFPLAHELRPEPVLQLTMSLLLHRIVDLCDAPDTNLADWFHFVWDRTRSIRKDISQQELCSAGAVQLVEQCARLHIHCAGRLVAEEPQVFDSKINSENLTKCLQSLKYLYHDLRVRGERCESEPEFRAYVVLLNLNDCQFFWELKQLPAEIMHAPEVRFALQVYMAIETSNYVRFFRLVRQTTYMNACILLRYFTQMRVVALQTMLKAYAPRQAVAMHLSYWQYALAFEDIEQTAQFFEYYGLQCDRADDRVMVDRTALAYPDAPFWLERAVNVVEHKRVCTVGEAIWGGDGRLPEFEERFAKYEPHDSFDANGCLLPESWMAEDQNYWKPSAAVPKERRMSVRAAELQEVPTFVGDVCDGEGDEDHNDEDEDNEDNEDHEDEVLDEDQADDDFDEDYVDEADNDMYSLPRRQDQMLSNDDASVFKMPALPSSNKSPQLAKSTVFTSIASKPSFPPASSIFGGSAFAASNANTAAAPTDNIFASVPVPNAATTTNIFGVAAANAPSANLFGSSAFALPNFATGNAQSSIFGTVVNATNVATVSVPPTDSIFGDSSIFASVPTKPPPSTSSSIFGGRVEVPPEPVPTPVLPPLRRRESLDREQQQLDDRLAHERDKLLQAQLLHNAAKRLVDDLLAEHIDDECAAIAAEALQRRRALDERATQILTELLTETVQEHTHNTLLALAEHRRATQHQSLAAKYFQRWTANVQRRRRQRQHLAVTPLWITADVDRAQHVPEQLTAPQQRETLQQRRRYRQGGRWTGASMVNGLQQQLQQQHHLGIRTPSHQHQPIDVCDLVADASSASKRPVFWKCLLSLPSDSARLQKWLDGILYRRTAAATQASGVLFCERHCSRDRVTTVCLRILIGAQLIDGHTQRTATPSQLAGADAIIFFMSALESATETAARLRAVQQLDLPLDVVLHKTRTDPDELTANAEALPIDGCVHTGRSLREHTANAMQNLCRSAVRRESLSALRVQRTTSFLMQTLGDQLWVQLGRSAHSNSVMLAALRDAGALVSIYNEALRRLRAIVADTFDAYPDFGEEFRRFTGASQPDLPLTAEHFPVDWKEPRRAQQLVAFFEALELKPADVLQGATSKQPDLGDRLQQYVREHFAAGDTAVPAIAWSLLRSVHQQAEANGQIVWLDAIKDLCLAKLNAAYAASTASDRLPGEVVYDASQLAAFCQQPWWLDGAASPVLRRRQQQQQQRHNGDGVDELTAMATKQHQPAAIHRIDPAMLDELMQRGRELVQRADVSIQTGRSAAARQPRVSAVLVRSAKRPVPEAAEGAHGGEPQEENAKKMHVDSGANAAAWDSGASGRYRATLMATTTAAGAAGNDEHGGDDLTSILARARARLERAERTIQKYYAAS